MSGLLVNSSHGLGKNLLEDKQKYNAFLGTSLGKHLFSKKTSNFILNGLWSIATHLLL